MKKIRFLIPQFVLILSVLFFSCSDSEDDISEVHGVLDFNISFKNSNNGKLKLEENVSAVLISISHQESGLVYEKEKLPVYNFNGEYISNPISLPIGLYTITEFLVLNGNDEIIYATPLEGSELAHLVEHPLPVGFSISKDETTKTTLEVVSTEEFSPSDFGYATFDFQIVDYSSFLIGVFTYNSQISNYELSEATLEVKANEVMLHTFSLEAITNEIQIVNSSENFKLIVTKPGYYTETLNLSFDELELYKDQPIVVKLLPEGFTSVTLKPDSEQGVDAILYDLQPDNNYGNHPQINALAWTNSGQPQTMRSLIQFDFSIIPPQAKIEGALLSLYHYVASANPGHSQISGSNESILQRVVEPWVENEVTWNTAPATTAEGEITISSSNSSDEDYLNQNILGLLVNEPTKELFNHYGVMLSLKTESHYRSLVFASSDAPESNLHPELEIIYSE
ncbi:DNRLRE domain-containing protein [Reichenbachiella sp.]|uniref:DNRLRE domain-containing protein n=1 Tax=Reichenbachiella sp. TaxID=2184521 RepID=UPI003BAEDFD9